MTGHTGCKTYSKFGAQKRRDIPPLSGEEESHDIE
jgi:hypothetical protein